MAHHWDPRVVLDAFYQAVASSRNDKIDVLIQAKEG
jgi:hypothetical protein